MKKCLFRISALLCFSMLAAAGFTACEENPDNPTDNFVYYSASGNISASGMGDVAEVTFWIPEYNSALVEAFLNTGEENDEKAIEICDKIYAAHKTSAAFANASGEVSIQKYRGLSSDSDEEIKPEKTLKVYKYDGAK